MSDGRITRRFQGLREERRPGLVTYVTAGDPDLPTFEEILSGLPEAGADLIEIGIPFTDPAADGPAIQAAGQRALAAGMSVPKALDAVARFRARDAVTPIVLMGYYNPILQRGCEAFAARAAVAGVDGLITVDLPPEEEDELRPHVQARGIDIVRLIAPTTDETRLPVVLEQASGFVYYVSIAGITGTRSPTVASVEAAVSRLRRFTDLPVAIGFGIRTPEQAASIGRLADAAVVGSAIVGTVADNLDTDGRPHPGCARNVLEFVARLAEGMRGGA